MFDEKYTEIVEPKYGIKRDFTHDEILTNNIYKKHHYSIDEEHRVDMTSYDTYSIDPDGCNDADDAFSIYTEDDKLYFAIHIADPTEYIELNSALWDDIVKRTTTKYPSNRKPIHMMPNKVLALSSLQGDHRGNIKKAITILTEIHKTSFEPIHKIKILFTNIFVKKDNAYTYKQASLLCDEIQAFNIGLKISESCKQRRSLTTKGIKLNEVSTAYPIYDASGAHLYEDTFGERMMKQMIAEFAIFANAFVGEYLKINLNMGIFRTCNASTWLQTLYSDITGDELLQEIITNGIRADYMSNVESHDLVGMTEYCHFTSPIRRLSDCICHYLLKYIHFKKDNYSIPFTDSELDALARRCLHVTRTEKKHQYLDIKFRLLQVMDTLLLHNKTIEIGYYITGYSGLFLNIIICKINNYHVHMSYSLRIRNYSKDINPKNIKFITVTQVNCFTRYDENTIPELDRDILHA
jgi:ribonuclease R